MQKIIQISLNDILADADGAAKRITSTCAHRSGPYRVSGICQVGEMAYVVLLPAGSAGPALAHRFVEIAEATPDDVIALLNERWSADFDCLGSVNTCDGLTLCLFAKTRNA